MPSVKPPAVSVIVAVRNGERHLDSTLSSIRHQALTDLEILVVDDHSTDSTRAIIERHRAADDRVHLLEGPGTGSAGSARNVGLDAATGRYLAFLDGDDLFSPRYLRAMLKRADRDVADVVVTGFHTIDDTTGDVAPADWGMRLGVIPPQRPFTPADLGDHLFLAVNPAAWNKLFRSDFIRKRGLRFQEIPRTNDAYFTYCAWAEAERLSYVDARLIDYRIGSADSLQATVARTPLDFLDALNAIRARLEQQGRFPALERAFVNRAAELCVTNLRRCGTFATYVELRDVLRGGALARLGVAGRPSDYFVSESIARKVAGVEGDLPAELFGLWQASQRRALRAETESRAARREMEMRAHAAAAPTSTVPAAPALAEDAGPAGPDLTFVIPVYNTARFLTECVASVQAQTGLEVEIICVNDGSTDSSADLLAQLADADSRIRVIEQSNAGLSVARNRGAAEAKGRYVSFLDSDDFWCFDSAAEFVRRADEERLDLLLFDAEPIREPAVDDQTWARYRTYYARPDGPKGVHPGVEILAKMQSVRQHRASACLYLLRRSFLEAAHLEFVPGLMHEDNLFTFEALLLAERARHLPVRLYGRRVRPGSITTTTAREAAARGYFISCLHMLRLVLNRHYPNWVTAELGVVIASMFQQAKFNFVRLHPDISDRFAEIDSGPDAQTLFRMLKRAQVEFRDAKRPVAKAAASKTPTGLARVRAVLVPVKRRLVAAARRARILS